MVTGVSMQDPCGWIHTLRPGPGPQEWPRSPSLGGLGRVQTGVLHCLALWPSGEGLLSGL